MLIKTGTRREFLDLIQGDGPRSLLGLSRTETLVHSDAELQLLWPDDAGDLSPLPSAIVVHRGGVRDFLAWAGTYLPTHRPLTAYCRVMDDAIAQTVSGRIRKPSLGRLEDVCTGVLIGETLSYLDPQRELRLLSPRASASTYSFCMSRALALGMLDLNSDPITDPWVSAREITKQAQLPIRPDVFKGPWAVILCLAEGGLVRSPKLLPNIPDVILDSTLELFNTGELRRDTWDGLLEAAGVHVRQEDMRGPREQRVRIVDDAFRSLASASRSGAHVSGFAGGFLTSQIGPGTLEHVNLLRPYISSLPAILAWYGLCAGLQSRGGVQSYAGGFGRRVMRDALKDERLLDRPSCDIALTELGMLAGTESSLLDFRTTSLNHIEIEIAPCVNTTLRWQGKDEQQPELFTASRLPDPEIKAIAFELEDIADQIDRLRERVSRSIGQSDRGRSRSDRTRRRR